MQFLALASILSIAFAAPVPTSTSEQQIQKRFVEDAPWILSNIHYFTPSASNSNQNSTFHFHFNDTNSGLQLSTRCFQSASTLTEGGSYACHNSTVEFTFDGSNVAISRNYIDPSLGDYPYDMAEAFGNVDLNFTTVTTDEGVTMTQTEAEVPITSLISKK